MTYKEGDSVIIIGNDGRMKQGVIRMIVPDERRTDKDILHFDGDAYVVDCDEKIKDEIKIRCINIIPLNNIIRLDV